MKCQRCGYGWETKSKLMFVSCPNCLTKVKNTDLDTAHHISGEGDFSQYASNAVEKRKITAPLSSPIKKRDENE